MRIRYHGYTSELKYSSGPHGTTNALVIEDKPLPDEPDSIQVGPLALPSSNSKEHHVNTPKERDSYLSVILNLFPNDGLHRFCYLAERLLPTSLREHLRDYQRKIRHYQITSSLSHNFSVSNIQDLDLFVVGAARAAEYIPKTLGAADRIQHLRMTANNLKVLGLSNTFADWSFNAEPFDGVCNAFPALRQFACQIEEEVYYNAGDCPEYPKFLDSLKRLSNLRTLHLLQWNITLVGGLDDYNSLNTSILVLQMQKFANKLFGDLDRARCYPLLDALVIGHLTRLESAMPQFYFVRGEQRDVLNRTVAIGVPVSRAVLRKTQAYTDVLDLDPFSEPWQQWAGRVIA
ncbi:hypothetical protein CC86DRAFT_451161 [Ophiobolus disseminans]|uniref:Uncharacterized protein n=1 Tax=Ophiobolus disseminans TaxID=1469910 RepID=A0A6A7ALL9_9PLEO|nr:hypothetical protein CC86DRAFT_451161 [Ophiobolus disseminans]